MKTLRSRYSLQLCIVLLVATLLPILVLYLLSASGLIEATYQVETSQLKAVAALQEMLASWSENPVRISVIPPAEETGRGGLPAFRDPQITIDPVLDTLAIATRSPEFVIASNVFNFRVEMPAWFVIAALPVISLGLGLLLSIWMSRSVTLPITRLAQAAQRIGRRDLACRVPETGSLELQDLSRSFNRMAGELAAAESSRRNLMADVAHELRTPLTVLQGNLRALLDGLRPRDEAEIALLLEQANHINRLVDDLRDLSLAESDCLALHRQPVDVSRLLEETAAYFAPLAQEQGIALFLAVKADLVHPALDELRLRQVLHNLLANAVRHTPSGGSIHLSAILQEESAVQILVSDSGEGIPPGNLDHIFDRFYAAAGSRDRGGTGLGLAITRALVEAQGGAIVASSGGIGQGSCFAVRFPCSG